MSNPIQDCTICGQAYWSVPGGRVAAAICPECADMSESEAAATEEQPPERPRFVALSALPPEKRLPPRRAVAENPSRRFPAPSEEPHDSTPEMSGGPIRLPRRSVVENSRVIAPSLPPAPQAVRPVPLPAPAAVQPPALVPPREPVPVPAIPAALQQIGFNCPSCFTVLVIKDTSTYDGRAAPCPYCAVTILPPRVAPPSPFTLLAATALPAEPAPANPGRLKWTNFADHPARAIHEAEVA